MGQALLWLSPDERQYVADNVASIEEGEYSAALPWRQAVWLGPDRESWVVAQHLLHEAVHNHDYGVCLDMTIEQEEALAFAKQAAFLRRTGDWEDAGRITAPMFAREYARAWGLDPDARYQRSGDCGLRSLLGWPL